jgi:hypothetical protein
MGKSCMQGYGGENLTNKDHLKDTGVDSKVILNWGFKKWNGGID